MFDDLRKLTSGLFQSVVGDKEFAPLRFGITPQFLRDLAQLSLQRKYMQFGDPQARDDFIRAQTMYQSELAKALPEKYKATADLMKSQANYYSTLTQALPRKYEAAIKHTEALTEEILRGLAADANLGGIVSNVLKRFYETWGIPSANPTSSALSSQSSPFNFQTDHSYRPGDLLLYQLRRLPNFLNY